MDLSQSWQSEFLAILTLVVLSIWLREADAPESKPFFSSHASTGKYYIRVSAFLLPHLKDRPVSLKRYPDGVDGFFFYEKNCPAYRPG